MITVKAKITNIDLWLRGHVEYVDDERTYIPGILKADAMVAMEGAPPFRLPLGVYEPSMAQLVGSEIELRLTRVDSS